MEAMERLWAILHFEDVGCCQPTAPSCLVAARVGSILFFSHIDDVGRLGPVVRSRTDWDFSREWLEDLKVIFGAESYKVMPNMNFSVRSLFGNPPNPKTPCESDLELCYVHRVIDYVIIVCCRGLFLLNAPISIPTHIGRTSRDTGSVISGYKWICFMMYIYIYITIYIYYGELSIHLAPTMVIFIDGGLLSP